MYEGGYEVLRGAGNCATSHHEPAAAHAQTPHGEPHPHGEPASPAQPAAHSAQVPKISTVCATFT